MFDTVTGEVLQATPQPPIPAPESESPQAAAAEAPPDGVAPMPWEQMEPLQTDGPVAQAPSVSTVAPPTDIIEPVMPPAVPVEVWAAGLWRVGEGAQPTIAIPADALPGGWVSVA